MLINRLVDAQGYSNRLLLVGLHAEQGHHHNGDRAPQRPYILCSIFFHSFGALARAVRLFIASLHNQPWYPKLGSIEIFVNRLAEIFKGDFSTVRQLGYDNNSRSVRKHFVERQKRKGLHERFVTVGPSSPSTATCVTPYNRQLFLHTSDKSHAVYNATQRKLIVN